MAMTLVGIETKNHCAGEDQQQFNSQVESVEGWSYVKWEAGTWSREQFGNPEEGERTPLEGATMQRLTKLEEAFMCAVVTVNFRVCNSLRLS
jgi:hypothetical protein